jgi:ribosomal protein S18 acetylase RimI-like enzyme
MRAILEHFARAAVVRAMEANVHELSALWGHALGAEFHDETDVTWFVSGLAFELCNGVIRAYFASENLERTIDATLTLLMARQVPMAWVVSPSTRPPDLGRRLQAYGWTLDDAAPGMAVDLLTLDEPLSAPSGLAIECVDDEEALKHWMRTVVTGSDLPERVLTLLLEVSAQHGFPRHASVRYYLGWLNGEPVATSLLFLGGGVAGIYNVATFPHARRQGVGTAVTLAALREARAMGYRIGTLQSTPMGLNVYRRLGFQAYGTFSFYFWPGKANG